MKKFVLTAVLASVCLGLLAACEDKKSTTPPPVDLSKPDVVIVGSEVEGMYLARAARDEGLAVVVIDPREKPGGQLIQGEMQYLDEPSDGSGKTLLQGRVKQLFDSYKKGTIRKSGEFQSYFDTLTDGIPIESGITITNIAIEKQAGSDKQKIGSVSYRTKDGTQKTVTARYFVDNTDFAAVTSKLGLKRIPGIETVFPGSKPVDHMAASLMMKFKGVDWSKFQKEIGKLSKKEREEKYGSETTVTDTFTWGLGNVGSRFKPSSPEVFLRGLNTINQRDGDVLINALLLYNVDPANPESVKKAVENGKKETDRIVAHLRQELPGWEQAEVNGYPNYLYIRDYDRYETEYVLQATDLMSATMYWDNVSIAGYPLDLQGTMEHTWGERKGVPDKYGMPLRSFIPKGYANVIVAGKNVGASAVAYGSARIQPNTSLAGEVIGIMMAKAGKDRLLSEVTEKEMKELQQYVEKKYDIRITGVKGKDKIAGLSDEQRRQFNEGKLVLP
ncbi:FAD-dependent oxidoreductase [Paenibacillus ginsengarvi]|uniref:FAD-dependent oxidoreductase n=1 Tax=Paenibacillus ginsengarvi TaxID=400777 RepID=A0A3B0CM11_9BACL|nr:FAD-dependent oxidoreductase [Paenibacillus ginsengarvi]RKN86433.1 FAD-dependent oxidoreductase [Paenibacillus ginsengarvi]